MTNPIARLWAAAASVLGLFLAWAGIAAHPWRQTAPPSNPTSQALTRYEQRLRADAKLVAQLAARRRATAAATPTVRIVTLPPLTTTRTS